MGERTICQNGSAQKSQPNPPAFFSTDNKRISSGDNYCSEMSGAVTGEGFCPFRDGSSAFCV